MNYLRKNKMTIFFSSLLTLSLFTLSCEDEELLIPCEEITFAVTTADSVAYTFTLNETGVLSDIKWVVGGDTLTEELSEELIIELQAGNVEICVAGTSVECGELVGFCATIEVKEVEEEETENCPEIEYSFLNDGKGNYTFLLEEGEATSITWIINDDTVDTVGPTFTSILDPGENLVCVSAKFERCESEVTFCKTITVETVEDCPELSFETIELPDNNYEFTLTSENPISTIWTIDGDIVSQMPNGFEKFFAPGEYEICATSTFENCESEVSLCKALVVEDICPEVKIATEVIEDGKYLFSIDLTDNQTEPSEIKWLVDGVVKSEGSIMYEATFEAGSYDVCVTTDFATCSKTIETCEVITVEDGFSGCPELAFTFQSGGTTEPNKYYFTADFPGIETLEWYGWFINGESIEDEGTMNNGDNALEYTFDTPGTYQVCLFTETPDCAAGTQFCKEIVIE